MIGLARFDRVLAKLPSGLSTDIREKGVNLSGGERQRLALARNLLAAIDSDIILMDEPTSSVDMANEKAIYEGIMEYFKGKTIISSVHKTYLLACFGQIVKIDRGRIV
jgi:ABC-type bacteriocin/lantibiotic exporter with double-glycine peptidase domain